jgi:hypothetical protein
MGQTERLRRSRWRSVGNAFFASESSVEAEESGFARLAMLAP